MSHHTTGLVGLLLENPRRVPLWRDQLPQPIPFCCGEVFGLYLFTVQHLKLRLPHSPFQLLWFSKRILCFLLLDPCLSVPMVLACLLLLASPLDVPQSPSAASPGAVPPRWATCVPAGCRTWQRSGACSNSSPLILLSSPGE